MERATLTVLDSSNQTYKKTCAIGNMIPATRENIPAIRIHSEEGRGRLKKVVTHNARSPRSCLHSLVARLPPREMTVSEQGSFQFR